MYIYVRQRHIAERISISGERTSGVYHSMTTPHHHHAQLQEQCEQRQGRPINKEQMR